ncbi:MAG: Rpn family recombination-promoting nuclease/putative transposase [Prevotellaceae bacterium]|jgi:predicted transposase/invertase (TIGR01784 family)|nr:Rpn family recombination-promoting nuclease/putative transposase [Prevotellaceae bacterium]
MVMDELSPSSVYLNPLTDFGFKKLFYNELNKDLLIHFLNEFIQGEHIVDIQYRPAEQLGEWEQERRATFDIFCTNEKGEYFIVEMQRARQEFFADRALFYSTFPIRNQAPKGKEWNYELKAVYFVAILDFVLFEEKGDEDYVVERVHLLRERTKTKFSEKLSFIFVELPKFSKPVEALRTNADRWLYSLKNLARLNNRPPEVRGRIFKKLFEAAQIKMLTPNEMEEYKKSITDYYDVRSAITYAEKRASEKAEERGRMKGRIEGREEGREEIVQHCAFLGMPVEEIAKVTNLSVGQVMKLLQNKQ